MCVVGVYNYRIILVEWCVGLPIHLGVTILLLNFSLWIPPQCWEPSIDYELYDDKLMNQYDHLSPNMVQKVWSYSTKWRTARAFSNLIMFFGLMIEAFPTHIISWVVGHAIHSGVALPVFSIISFFLTIRTDWWLGHTIHPGVALPVKVPRGALSKLIM